MARERVIILIGVDGSGKTRHAKKLVSEIARSGRKCSYLWMRHDFFFSWPFMTLCHALGFTVVHKLPISRTYSEHLYHRKPISLVWPWIRLLDGILFVSIRTHIRLISGHLLVVDRFVHDILVDLMVEVRDPHLYKSLVGRLLLALAPAGSITLLLDIDEQTALKRKSDVPNPRYLSVRRRHYRSIAQYLRIVKINSSDPFTVTHERLLMRLNEQRATRGHTSKSAITVSEKREAVIVTWARGGGSINAIRSLGKRGIRVIAIDSIRSSRGFRSKFTAKAIVCPERFVDLNAYKHFLVNAFEREKCLTVIPMDEITAYVLSKYRGTFEENTNVKMPWPEYWQLEMVQNRERLLSLAKELSIPAPKYSIGCDMQRIGSELNGPWVIKPGYPMMVKGNKVISDVVRYASNVPELESAVKKMRLQGLNPIVQEFIPGEGYGFFALYNRGEIRASFQHHRLRESSYKGGASSLRESVKIPELEREGRKIPQKLKWHGPIMVEFRRDRRNGRFTLMEVNPRFWGSLNLAIQSGIDFPYLFYQMAKDGDCERAFEYKVGVKCKNLQLDLFHLESVFGRSDSSFASPKPSLFRTLISILWSGFSVKDDYLALNDPLPFIYELLHMTKRLIRRNESTVREGSCL